MRELVLGVTLGLAAGVAPGPLLALLVSATLERGTAAGARVAFAPLLTDTPIVALSVLVLDGLPSGVVAALSLAGGLFVVWLGASDLRAHSSPTPAAPSGSPVRRAVAVNLLSPHPWLFWIGVGGPLLLEAADDSAALAIAFVLGFYGALVGSKLVIATGVGATRGRLLAGRGYAIALRATAILMLATGALLIVEAARALT